MVTGCVHTRVISGLCAGVLEILGAWLSLHVQRKGLDTHHAVELFYDPVSTWPTRWGEPVGLLGLFHACLKRAPQKKHDVPPGPTRAAGTRFGQASTGVVRIYANDLCASTTPYVKHSLSLQSAVTFIHNKSPAPAPLQKACGPLRNTPCRGPTRTHCGARCRIPRAKPTGTTTMI